MIALVPTVYGRAEELIVAVVPGSTTSMIPDFAGSQRMALIGYGNRERSMPASIAESVFSLEQQLVVKPWFVVHNRRTARPQGADRKRIEWLVATANTGGD